MIKTRKTEYEILSEIVKEIRKPKSPIEKIQPWLNLALYLIAIIGLIYAVGEFDFSVKSYKEQLAKAEEIRLQILKIDTNSAIIELEYNILTIKDYINQKDKYTKYNYRISTRFETENLTNLIRNGTLNDPELTAEIWNSKNHLETLDRRLDEIMTGYFSSSTEEAQEWIRTQNQLIIDNMEERVLYFEDILSKLNKYYEGLN